MIIFAFYLFVVFLATSILTTLVPNFRELLPKLEQLPTVYLSYPLLFLNLSVAFYIGYFLFALDADRTRVYSICVFFGLSIMAGSGASLAFSVITGSEIVVEMAFGSGFGAVVVFGLAAIFTYKMADNFANTSP